MEETCAVAWTVTCEREDISELEFLIVFAITLLNDWPRRVMW